MASLYVITGPAGVGKTTISKIIAETLDKSALIEGDDIYGQVVGGYQNPWEEGNHLDTHWKVCLSTIRTYLEDGYDVVFNYIISNQQIADICRNFADYEVRFTVLMVDEETLLQRDKLRPEDCQMNERCLVLLNDFRNGNYDPKFVLETSKQGVKEIVRAIKTEDRFIVE